MSEEANESQESVDFNEFEDIKPGQKEETKVSSITKGTQADFRNEKYWENVEGSKEAIDKAKKSAAVEVQTDNGAIMVLNLPANKKVSPRSHLALWKKTYGEYPKEGQVVTTKIDENGFNKIVLESV